MSQHRPDFRGLAKSILLCTVVLLMTACASPSTQKEADVNKEMLRLAQAVKGKTAKIKVVFNCYDYHGKVLGCSSVNNGDFEKSFQWVKTIPADSSSPYDIFIGANMIYREIYTDKVGGSATASALTLGLVPSTHRQSVALDIGVSVGGKKVFDKKFQVVDEANIGLWSYQEDIAKMKVRMSKRVMADFIRELEGSGVLDSQ